METRIAELRYKEVISVTDGSRFGYVGDMEVDLESGQVRALVVPGRLRLFGLLGREEDRYIPWDRSQTGGPFPMRGTKRGEVSEQDPHRSS